MARPLTMEERRQVLRILEQRRDAAVAEITAKDPGWKLRIEQRKNKVAIGRLKVEKEVLEKQKIEGEIRALQHKLLDVESRISKKMPLQERGSDRYSRDVCPMPMSLCQAVTEICDEVHATEMSKDPAGRKVLDAEAVCVESQAALALCSTRDELVARKVL